MSQLKSLIIEIERILIHDFLRENILLLPILLIAYIGISIYALFNLLPNKPIYWSIPILAMCILFSIFVCLAMYFNRIEELAAIAYVYFAIATFISAFAGIAFIYYLRRKEKNR
jgi:peptidoglycan/LPS O-acetylase OafA/YrhL